MVPGMVHYEAEVDGMRRRERSGVINLRRLTAAEKGRVEAAARRAGLPMRGFLLGAGAVVDDQRRAVDALRGIGRTVPTCPVQAAVATLVDGQFMSEEDYTAHAGACPVCAASAAGVAARAAGSGYARLARDAGLGALDDEEVRRIVHAVARADPTETVGHLLTMAYGLDGAAPMSFAAIGRSVDWSREYARRKVAAAVEAVRAFRKAEVGAPA
jgi:hypothetical protein